jgi:glycosyltransferase involved in cell wall biosynthesis
LGLKISIYNEPAGSGIGGSEFVAALLAEALARDHRVDLYHRIPSLTVEKLAANSGTMLNNVRLQYVDKPNLQPQARNPLTHYRELKKIQSELSEGYDIFVAIIHDVPPFSYAKKGALIVLFPAPTAPYVKPAGGVDAGLAWKRPGRYLYQSWAWKKRMESYGLITAISDFSRIWTKRRWGIDCTVIYPPVNTSFNHVDKEKIILSVGRFALQGDGHRKNQEEMLEVYDRMQRGRSLDWKYFCSLLAAAPHSSPIYRVTN